MVDAVLALPGIPLFALDLTRVPADGPVAKWMASKPPQRMMGNVVFAPDRVHRFDYRADPRDNFDVILFAEHATAARGIPRLAPREAPPVSNEEPTNLALAGSNGVPDGWSVMDHGFYPNDPSFHPYALAVANEPSPGGGRTVRIARAGSPLWWGDAALGQSFPATRWRGRRLVFSAAMRADAPRIGTGAKLVVLVWPKRSDASDDQATVPIMALQSDGPVRSSDWVRRSVAVDVPDDAERVQISFVVTGNSAGWFGDLKLESPGAAKM
jgi:hypothetical protein